MVFIKLVVLILVCGSSGVGLLSVRQSRLQAAHEMAEARHRIRQLEEQAGELRAKIAQASTPDRVAALLKDGQRYQHAVQNLAMLKHDGQQVEQYIEPTVVYSEVYADMHSEAESEVERDRIPEDLIETPNDDEHIWILNDGSRVIIRTN